MSAENEEQKDYSKFAEEFSAYTREMLKRLSAKFPDVMLDAALVVNWTPEITKAPVPRLFVESFRPDGSGDPVNNTLELSDLMNLGSQQLVRQLLQIVVHQNIMMQQRLGAMTDQMLKKPESKLVVP